MKKIVNFVPRDLEVSLTLEGPKPSKKYIPEWYGKMGSSWRDSDGFLKAGPTKCLPLLDSFTSGYIHELPCDVEIKYLGKNPSNGKDMIQYHWTKMDDSNIRPIITRQEESNGAPYSLPSFDGYYDAEFQWYTMWDPETPAGYSTIYHHPNNRFDLPFMTFSGITDTDGWSGAGPIPFLIKRGFEGIIPAGTPIIQFSFIKREDWKSKIKEFDTKSLKKKYSVKKYIMHGYKKEYWKKKSYE
jgi:hypothetical protein